MLLYIKIQISHCGLRADLIPVFLSFPSLPTPSSKGSSHTVLCVLKLIQFFTAPHHHSPPHPCPQILQAVLPGPGALPCRHSGLACRSPHPSGLCPHPASSERPGRLISREHLSPSLCPPHFHSPVSLDFFHRLYHSLKLSWSWIDLLLHCLSPLNRM